MFSQKSPRVQNMFTRRARLECRLIRRHVDGPGWSLPLHCQRGKQQQGRVREVGGTWSPHAVQTRGVCDDERCGPAELLRLELFH